MNMNEMFEIFEVQFEIYIGNSIQRQFMQAPRIMLEQKFVNLMEQSCNDSRPIKIKISRQVPVYNQFINQWVNTENNIIFMNNAWEKMWKEKTD